MKIYSVDKLFLFSCVFLLLHACNLRQHPSVEEMFDQAAELQKDTRSAEAMALYYEVLSRTDDPRIQSRTYQNLGAIYMWDRVFDKAIEAYIQAYQRDSLLRDTSHMVKALEAIGTIRFALGDSIGNRRLYARAVHLAQLANDSANLAEIYRKTGWHYQTMNQFDSAAYYTRLSMSYSRTPAKLYSTLAEIYRQRQDIDSARHYFDLGIHAPNTEDRLASLFFSAQLEHATGNDTTAYNRLLAYTLSVDTLYAQQKTLEIEKLAYRHEAELKIRGVEERHRLYIGLGILALTVAASAFLLVLQNQRRKKREEQLKYEAALQGLNEKIALLKDNLNVNDREREALLLRTEEQIARLRAVTLKDTAIGRRIVRLAGQDNKDKRNIRVLTEKEQTELQKAVADIYADETARLKERYPRLTEGDLLYYCLASAEFSTFAIALCFGNTDTGIVAQRKRRMKLRMMEAGNELSSNDSVIN